MQLNFNLQPPPCPSTTIVKKELNLMEELKSLDPFIIRHHPTGSRFICDPPPLDTDQDYVVLVKNHLFYDLLDGSEVVPVEDYDITDYEGFQSVKKGYLNLILTASPDFYDKFVLATNLAKERNLLLKTERIALFQEILYGNLGEANGNL